MMKQFKQNHKEAFSKGEDVRNPQKLIQAKEKKLKAKSLQARSKDKKGKGNKKESKINSLRVQTKMAARMRP